MRTRLTRFALIAIAAFASGAALSGCAGLGDGFASGAFVDPAKYDLYDCERLKNTRSSLDHQLADNQALIDKARTARGGTVIGEAVYRSDNISLRAQKKSVDEYWQRNGCDAVTPPPAPTVPPAKP